jgi:hypothetical protein
MLSKERHQQHRSLFQASKLRDMLKQSTPGTLSPETTTTTSSGYSTGGSSVSTSINPFLKKFSSSSAATSTVRKEHHHQQQKQQTRKSKGKKNKNIMHVAKEPIYALAISIVPLQMTFTIHIYMSHLYII